MTIALPLSPEAPRSRKGPLAWLIVSQALVVLSLFPWAIVAAATLMIVRSMDPAVLAGTIVVVGYPVYSLALAIGAWVSYRRGKTRRAMVLTTLPLVPACTMLLFFLW